MLLLDCSICFPIKPASTSPGVALLTMRWDFPHQFLMEKMPHRLTYLQTWGRYFFQLRFLLPRWPHFLSKLYKKILDNYQVDYKHIHLSFLFINFLQNLRLILQCTFNITLNVPHLKTFEHLKSRKKILRISLKFQSVSYIKMGFYKNQK